MKNKQQKQKKAEGSISKRIRDTERILKRENLSADMKSEQERKLKALKVLRQEERKSQIERKYSEKYRMLKFFERQKCIKRIKSLSKQLLTCSDRKIQDELEEYKRKLNYVYHFPRNKKYVSLFPTTPYTDPKVLEQIEEQKFQIMEKITSGNFIDACTKLIPSIHE